LTAVLTVMSDMNLHIISETYDEFWLSLVLGLVKMGFIRLWVGNGETL
jgi:hypothetical protein